VAGTLRDDWLAGWVGCGHAPGASGGVQIVVSGAPDGDPKWFVRVDDGVVAEAASGAPVAPDVTLTVGYDDAVAIAAGDLDPGVAFMQGRLKTVGDPGLVLDVLAAGSAARR
jgi:hypothetical protein